MILDEQCHETWTSATMGDAVAVDAGRQAAVGDGTPSVVVIDADVTVRRSLKLLIRAAGWEAETFPSAEEFLAQMRCAGPCCVVVTLTLPGLSGLELQTRLAGRPELPFIFMTSNNDVRVAVQAMKAGAVECLTTPVNDVALLQAIEAAIEWSSAVLGRESELRPLRNRYASLTPREREVMAFVVFGLLNKQIGAELGISEITVKAHRGQVMRKMEAASLPHLVTMAAQLGARHARRRAYPSLENCGRRRGEAAL